MFQSKEWKGVLQLIDRKLLFGIKNGEIISNYKELCNTLKLPVLSGNSKKAQEKELSRYIDFSKEGHKYIINKVYSEPLPDLSMKGSLYYDALEFVLCKILNDYISINGTTLYCATMNELAESVGFVNDLYFRFLWHKNKLSAQLDVPLEIVEKLYKESQRNYKSIIYRTLNNMEKSKIIKFQEVYYVQEVDEKEKIVVETTKDKYGDEVTTAYRPVDITGEFRKATQEEVQKIAEIEFQTLEQYEVNNVYELYNLGIAGEYYKIVQQRIINKLGIGRYYKVIEIYLVKEGLEKRKRKLSDSIKEINDKFYNKLINNENENYKLVADRIIRLP